MATRINSKEYAWSDVSVVLYGRTIGGLRAIDYKTTVEKELLYGAGQSARSIQHGRRAHSGNITITQNELKALNEIAKENGYDSLLDVEIDIVVSYARSKDDTTILIDNIIDASFSELPSGMKEGDMNSEHVLPFVALDIEYDARN